MIKKWLVIAGILFVIFEVIDTLYFVFFDVFEGLKTKKGTNKDV